MRLTSKYFQVIWRGILSVVQNYDVIGFIQETVSSVV